MLHVCCRCRSVHSPRCLGARPKGPGHCTGTGTGPACAPCPESSRLPGAETKTPGCSSLLQQGRRRAGVNRQMDGCASSAALADIIQRDKAELAQDIYPWQALLSYPQLQRKMQCPQNRPEQSRENGPSTPSGTYSLISGSKTVFTQRTVNFGKVLPVWAKKTDYINTEKSDVGKKLWCSSCGKVLCGGARSASLLSAEMHRSLHLQVNVQKTPTHTQT